MDEFRDKILSVSLLAAVGVASAIVKSLGVDVAGKILCKAGIHEWKPVEGKKYLMFCSRCHITDDIRVSGITGEEANES